MDDATGIGVGIWCHASSCAANDSSSTFGPAASVNLYSADVTVEDPSSPTLSASGSLWGISPVQWISGVANPAGAWILNFGASDPAGPCELQAVIVNGSGGLALSDTNNNVFPNYTEAAPCGARNRSAAAPWRPQIAALPSGTYYLHVQANNPAGLIAPNLVERLNVDNTPPALSIASDTPQADSHWVEHAVTFQLGASKPAGLSGVQAIHYQLDSGAWQTVEGASASVTVDGTGQHAIVAYATDNAGNSSSIERSTALIDQTPPTGVFEPISPNNPRQLVADVADGDSGVAGGDIELEVEGQWQSIPTTFNGTQLIGFVNDDKLPRGYWPARAIVTDAAGNTAVVNALGDGTAMVVPIPLRLRTRVLAGTATKRVRVCSVKRVPVGDERISGSGAPPSRLTRICSTVTEPSSHGPLKLAFHQRGEATGVLSTSAGAPVAGAAIEVIARPPGWPARRLATLTTNAHGRFSYRIPAGPSRTITFRYPGTAILHDSIGTVTVTSDTAGTLVIDASALKAGRTTLFAGRVLGGFIPAGGKIVQLQYRLPRASWSPFRDPIYTDRAGRWRLRVPIGIYAAGYTYRFRALLPAQAGWPYRRSVSTVQISTVR